MRVKKRWESLDRHHPKSDFHYDYYLDIECMPKHNKILVLEKCRLKDYIDYTARTLHTSKKQKNWLRFKIVKVRHSYVSNLTQRT